MKIKLVCALALVGALAVGSEARAQLQFEFAPFAGGTFFLADPPSQFLLHDGPASHRTLRGASFDDAWTFGANAGVVFNERWAIEGLFSYIPTKVRAEGGLTGAEDVDGYMYGITGVFYILDEGRVRPFVGAGLGGETFSYKIEGIESHTDLMGNVLAGINVRVTETFGIRLEARDCFARFHSGLPTVDDAWENDLMTTIGLSFRTSLGN